MQEWLRHADNKPLFDWMYGQILYEQRVEDMFRNPDGSLNPDLVELEKNQRRLSLEENLIEEAPNEHLDEHDLKMRRLQSEPASELDGEDEG